MIANSPAVERIARVLARERSRRSDGSTDPSPAADADTLWAEYRAQAVAILESLREPPPEVVRLGVSEAWARGVEATLEGHPESAPAPGQSDPEPGPIEEIAKSARHFLRAPS